MYAGLLRPQLSPIALRYVTEIPPCQEAEPPKVSTRSATPNARPAIGRAAKPAKQCPSSAIGGTPTTALARSAGTTRLPGSSPCKPNTPPGTTPCRIASVTPLLPRPCRRSSIWISMNSLPSYRRRSMDAIDRPGTRTTHPQLSGKIHRTALAPLDEHQGKMRRNDRQWQSPTVTSCCSSAPLRPARAVVHDHRNRCT
jgi:hypothetical protein